MVSAKEITLKVIPSKIANVFIKRWHYSGKVVNNSQLHFGAFLNNVLHGVMSFGCSLDKRKIMGLVKDTGWNEFLELNRMAFDNILPRNSESRCISIAMKLLKKHAPQIKWVVSFADGTQCGDGTIYRASGFVLTGINGTQCLVKMPNGEVRHRISLHIDKNIKFAMGGKNARLIDIANKYNGEVLSGFQLRYIYFIDKSYKSKLTVPILPFSEIEKRGAKMYLGKRPASIDGDASNLPVGNEGDSSSTAGLKAKLIN